jgi:competence protein ComEA
MGRGMKLWAALAVFLFIGSNSFADTKDTTKRVWAGKLNINSASEADFTVLPGIGKVTAHRIVKFREEVGGFKAVSELKRVKGISEALFSKIEPNLTLFEKSDLRVLIDINSATEEALKGLPGMSAGEARLIIEYRERNEGFKKVEDMHLAGISVQQYEEIKDLVTVLPYVAVKGKP